LCAGEWRSFSKFFIFCNVNETRISYSWGNVRERTEDAATETAGNMETDPISAAPLFGHRASKLWEVLQLRNNFEYVGRKGKVTRKAALLGAAALAVAGTLVGSKPAAATPSGLTFYPSTDLYGKGTFHFDADTYTSTSLKNATATSIGLEYGLGPDNSGSLGRSELGFDYVTSNTNSISFTKRLLLNAKTQLYNNDASQIRVVAGFWGLGSSGSSNDIAAGRSVYPGNVGYLLASKNFEFGRIHVGVAHSFAKTSVIGNDKTYLQLGYDKVFAGNKLQFTADYYSGKSAISALAPGIIYYLNDKSDFELGYVHYNDRSISPRNQIYLGFDYNFGPGTEKTNTTAPAPETDTAAPAKN